MHILVISIAHGLVDKGDQLFAHRKIRKALTKVDRTQLRSQRAHYRKDRRTYLGKLADNGRRGHSRMLLIYLILMFSWRTSVSPWIRRYTWATVTTSFWQ